MKKFEVIFTDDERGTIHCSSMNDGFTGLELCSLLEFKKNDIINQMRNPAVFKRTKVDEDGVYEITEESGND